MEKLIPNLAHRFVGNKYTVFTMGGTEALRFVNSNVKGAKLFLYTRFYPLCDRHVLDASKSD